MSTDEGDYEPHRQGDDQRLFDRGRKRGHDGGGASAARQKSRVGGVWMADCVTLWGDKRSFPVVANGANDVLYVYSELHSGWICLT